MAEKSRKTNASRRLEFRYTKADSRSGGEDKISQNDSKAAQSVDTDQLTENFEDLHLEDSQKSEDLEVADESEYSLTGDSEESEDPKNEEESKYLEYSEEAKDSEKEKESEGPENGEWLSSHPWDSDKPNPAINITKFVLNSASYPISKEWTTKDEKVDLAKVYESLPKFTETEMKGAINNCRSELEEMIKNKGKTSNPGPHVLDILESPKDKAVQIKDKKFKTSSLNSPPITPKEENYFYFDCEHMLKMYVPPPMLSLFETQQTEKTRWIKKIKYKDYKEKRWIFIPSFRRAQIALLKWPEDDRMNDKSTIRILVVRPSEFDEYVRYCGHLLPVIRIPQDEIGVGYARHWAQKIAQHLELHYIWMTDDSVECFYEYHPDKQPPKGSYSRYRRRQFGLVFERIENFVKEADDSEHPIAAMSPKRFNPRFRLKNSFVCAPPQCAVYLNIRKLNEKKIYYRPELKTFEDMIFGYECEQKGLKVFRDNRIMLQDHSWKNTGASSPSLQKGVRHQKHVYKKSENSSKAPPLGTDV